MALPLRRGRAHALLLVLALALVGCGGVPEGPVLPAIGPEPPAYRGRAKLVRPA